MADFDVFNMALHAYTDSLQKTATSSPTVNETCTHDRVHSEQGVDVCVQCGQEISKRVDPIKEWRYYGRSEGHSVSDPTRVQVRKTDERSIHKDVANMGFSEKVIRIANDLYFQVTKGKIFRGNSRKAIIFACIFHAYKLTGNPKSHEKLISVFNLKRKTCLRGLKHVNLHAPKTSPIRTSYITPVNLIEEIMDKFSASEIQKKEVVALYHCIKNRSSQLNRSRPQSVASGLVYYWIKNSGKEITLKQFTDKIPLSELTINKITREIETIVDRAVAKHEP